MPPAGFDPTIPLKQTAALYGVSVATAHKWRKKVGYKTPLPEGHWTDTDIHRLRTMYSGSSLNDIAAVLGRSVSSVKSKAVSLGLRRSTGQFAPDRAPQIRGRVQGQADMAADYIRSHDRTPVYRCDREGKPNPKAKFWKYGYGSLVLTEDALIAKAERKGWKSDAWQEIA